jgi:hypothetical protein
MHHEVQSERFFTYKPLYKFPFTTNPLKFEKVLRYHQRKFSFPLYHFKQI